MNKLSYGNFDSSNNDIAYSSTSGYNTPASEDEVRKQLSYPLKEIKTFVNNTVTVKGTSAVQLVLSDEDKLQYRTDPSGELNDIVVGESKMQSFVGMVVMGVNLTTEASVKALYGSATGWTLLSSVILASNHVFGNGKTLGLSNGTKQYGLTLSTGTGNHVAGGHESAYGVDVGSSYSGNFNTSSNGTGTGVITKAEADNYDKTGLIVDTETVYTWKRTV